MQVRGRGNAVAIALAGLAVVIAATGTAVAVTATTVTIADPTTPTRVAHVDNTGRLTVSGPHSTLDFTGASSAPASVEFHYLTLPTTASFALAEVSATVRQTQAGAADGSAYEFVLARGDLDPGSAATECSRDVVHHYVDVRRISLVEGQSVQVTFPEPLIVAPAASGRKFCLTAVVESVNDANTGYIDFGASGFVTRGSYTGPGTQLGGG